MSVTVETEVQPPVSVDVVDEPWISHPTSGAHVDMTLVVVVVMVDPPDWETPYEVRVAHTSADVVLHSP